MNKILREKLLAMTDTESQTRQTLATEDNRYDGYPEKLEALHRQQAEELLHIINEYGWPGQSLVEKDGATAAFKLARNAISKPDLQQQFFKYLKEAVRTGEASAIQEECLQDCILFYQGKPQQCGMFFEWDENGELVVNVENIVQANERRKKLGLKTVEEDLLLHKNEMLQQGGGPPKDFIKHKQQEIAWAKKVGWRNA